MVSLLAHWLPSFKRKKKQQLNWHKRPAVLTELQPNNLIPIQSYLFFNLFMAFFVCLKLLWAIFGLTSL